MTPVLFDVWRSGLSIGIAGSSQRRLTRFRGRAVVCMTLALVWAMFSGTAICHASSRPGVAPQSKAKTPKASSSPYGQTIFSRSDQTATASPSSSAEPARSPSDKALVSDAVRTSLTYDSYKLEIHLDPARHSIAVHAHLVAHNSGGQPLDRIVLQLSSSLRWYSIRVDGAPAKFETEPVESDIDHTGQLTEAVVPLTSHLAPDASIRLDVMYSGTIEPSSQRLLRLGAPASVANTSDWDQIAPGFTALRGFGNVIWFPVSTAPVLLGQGNRMFDSIGKWKRRELGAQVEMKVLVEYEGTPPIVALLNGHAMQPEGATGGKSTSPATDTSPDTVPRVASFHLPPTTLGFSPLSLFVIQGSHEHFPGLDIYTRPGNEAAAAAYQEIVEGDRPLVERWLGPHAKRPVILVDLPNPSDLPFEQDNLLLLPLDPNVTRDQAGPVLAQALSHAYFISPRSWLDEGVARWMGFVWLEQRAGRGTAIAQMDALRPALALAETSDPGADPGQSLIDAWSEIYYRGKAADVLWMLRDITGDEAFSSALQSYNPTADRSPDYFEGLLEKSSGKDLRWFFEDWVYRDRGLPDLHIVSAYQRPIQTKNSTRRNYLVSVEVWNDSFCSAEVPITVKGGPSIQTRRLQVPAHVRATLHVLLATEPSTAIVNDGSVPEVRASTHEKSILSTP